MLSSAAPAAFLHPAAQMCRLSHSLPPSQPCASHPRLPRACSGRTQPQGNRLGSCSPRLCSSVLQAGAWETCLSHRNPSARDIRQPHPTLHSAITQAGTRTHLNPSRTCTLSFQAGRGFTSFSAAGGKDRALLTPAPARRALRNTAY